MEESTIKSALIVNMGDDGSTKGYALLHDITTKQPELLPFSTSAGLKMSEVALAIAIFAYLAGWTYRYVYFYELGVPISMVDIPVYEYLVQSLSVICTVSGCVSFVVFFVCILLLFLQILPRWAYLLLIVVALIMFPVIAWIGKSNGEEAASKVILGEGPNKNILFQFKEQTDNLLPSNIAECQAGKSKASCVLLAQTDKGYFVFHQFFADEYGVLPDGKIYFVPSEQVLNSAIAMRRRT